jgi:hypothetical protein
MNSLPPATHEFGSVLGGRRFRLEGAYQEFIKANRGVLGTAEVGTEAIGTEAIGTEAIGMETSDRNPIRGLYCARRSRP